MKTIPTYIIDCAVKDCNDVHEFANKYRKSDRFNLRGKNYVDSIIQSHISDINERGYTCISHHDNITGEFISFIQPN